MSIQVNKPEFRFKEFNNDEWNQSTLGDIIQILSGFAFKSSFFSKEGKPLLTPKNFTKTGRAKFNAGNTKCTIEIVDEKYLCKSGDLLVLLTDLTPSCELLGKPVVLADADGEVLLNQRIIKISVDTAIVTKKFLANVFLTERYHRRIKSTATGTTVRHSSNKIICTYETGIPSLPEQQKIADFLSTVDQKIQALIRKKELLEEYKKGVMQKIFKQEIRFKPAPSVVEGEEDGNDYPDWEEKRLNEISAPIKRTSERAIENIMTISGANGFMHQKERFSQVIAAKSLSKYTHLLKDEFAYNRGNSKSYKYGCVYKMKDDEALIPYVYHSFKLNHGVPNFMEQLFRAKYLDRQLRRLISSSARMDGLLNIGGKSFFDVKVIFPVIEEQQKIATFLSGIDTKIESVSSQITQIQTWKKGLLQKMFV